MEVFHGSTIVIKQPLVAAGRKRLDFGLGFYVTDIRQQAESWAERMQHYRYYKFDYYDNAWLQFIIAKRKKKKDVEKYDVIEGGVANDRVIDTVEAYMANMMTLETALRELSRHKPNNQLCITNQKIVDTCMVYIESYNI